MAGAESMLDASAVQCRPPREYSEPGDNESVVTPRRCPGAKLLDIGGG